MLSEMTWCSKSCLIATVLVALWLVFSPLYAASAVNSDRIYRGADCWHDAHPNGFWWKMVDCQVNKSSRDISILLGSGKLLGGGLEFLSPLLSSFRGTVKGFIGDSVISGSEVDRPIARMIHSLESGFLAISQGFIVPFNNRESQNSFFIKAEDNPIGENVTLGRCCRFLWANSEFVVELVHYLDRPSFSKQGCEVVECHFVGTQPSGHFVSACKNRKIPFARSGDVTCGSGGGNYKLVINCGDLADTFRITIPDDSHTVGGKRYVTIGESKGHYDGSVFSLGPCGYADKPNKSQQFYLQIITCESSLTWYSPRELATDLEGCGVAFSVDKQHWYDIGISSKAIPVSTKYGLSIQLPSRE